MYQEVFDFSGRPFTMAPFVKHFFSEGPVKQAVDQINAGIDRDAGPSVVIGQHGTGKSLLLALLAEQHQQRFKVISLTCGPMSERRDLLQGILFELKQPYRDLSEGELRLALIDFIKLTDNCPNGVLLLVDEAQALTADLLDEIRLITNFVRDGVPRIRVVLCGTEHLEEVLTEPKLEPFNQRISGRSYLANLTRAQTQAYIHEHVARVGGDAGLMFDQATTDAIHDNTCGCPRFINQLSEQCMIFAATHGSLVVESAMVEPAWAQVQGLPTSQFNPSDQQVPQPAGENWTVIEFGSLDDDDLGEASESDQAVEQLDQAADPDEAFDSTYSTTGFADFEPDSQPNFDAASEFGSNATVDDYADPYVAQDPSNEIAVDHAHDHGAFDEHAETDNADGDAYAYDSIGQVDESFGEGVDEAAGDRQSIPTEIQSLNEDQESTWAQANMTSEPALEFSQNHDVLEVSEQPEKVQDSSDSLVGSDWSAGHDEEHSENDSGTDQVLDAEAQPESPLLESESDGLAEQTAENPFAESFESEECVPEGFSQFVAEQNAASMTLTGNELDSLPVVDSEANAFKEDQLGVAADHGLTDFGQSDPVSNVTSEAEQPVQDSTQFYDYADPADEEVSLDVANQTGEYFEASGHQVVTDEVALDADQADEQQEPVASSGNVESSDDNFSLSQLENAFESAFPAEADNESAPDDQQSDETDFRNVASAVVSNDQTSDEPQNAVPTADADANESVVGGEQQYDDCPPTSPIAETFHEHQTYEPTPDIQDKVDQILSGIGGSDDGVVENERSELSPASDRVSGDGQSNIELTDAQKILSEILEQKNLVSEHVRDPSGVASTLEQDFPQSVPMTSSLTEVNRTDATPDDSDMIVVQETLESSSDSNADEAPVVIPDQVSIGRAQRMDYEKLFEQLRDVGSDQ